MLVKGNPIELKKAMIELEDGTKLGRLFDIDVINSKGNKISRLELGMAPRKCIVCDEIAHVCSRSRAHSVEEMLEYINKVIKGVGR